MRFEVLLLHYQRLEVIDDQYVMLKAALGKYFDNVSVNLDFSSGPLTGQMATKLKKYYSDVVVSTTPLGLSESVVGSVSRCLNRSDYVLVLEDDLVISNNIEGFIDFALECASREELAGVSLFSTFTSIEGCYTWHRPTSWGWITSSQYWPGTDLSYDWFYIEWNRLSLYNRFEFYCRYGLDIVRMANRAIEKKNDSWFIRYVLYSYLNGYNYLTPGKSLVKNFGTSLKPTHGREKPFPFFTPKFRPILYHNTSIGLLNHFLIAIQYTRFFKFLVSIIKRVNEILLSKQRE